MDLPDQPVVNQEQRTWAMIAHLSAFAMYLTGIGHILGPLIVWLMKRDGNPFVDDQAKEALNFQITCSILFGIGIVLCFTIIFAIIGIPMLWALGIYHVVCMLIAAVKSYDGVAFRYPMTIRFIK